MKSAARKKPARRPLPRLTLAGCLLWILGAGAPADLRAFLKFLLSDEAAALAAAHVVPLPPGARNQLAFELEQMR